MVVSTPTVSHRTPRRRCRSRGNDGDGGADLDGTGRPLSAVRKRRCWAYPQYQSRHIDRIGAALVVPWGLEGLSIVALLVLARDRTMRMLAVAGAALMGLILLVTMIWAAPVHGELLDGFDSGQHDTLMASNLVRTLLGTARGGVAMVWRLLTVALSQSARQPREKKSAWRYRGPTEALGEITLHLYGAAGVAC